MHQYKTIAQTFLVLSILNVVFAAPVVPREVRETGNDVVVVAEDVTTVSERRRGASTSPDGTTPSQYSPSSNGSPPHDSLPLEGSTPLQGSAPSSWSAPSSHLSPMDGQVPVQDSTTEASTSAHPLSAAGGPAPASVPVSNTEASTSSHHSSTMDGPVPVHDSTGEGSTSPHYTAVTLDMLNKVPPSRKVVAAKRIAGLTLLVGSVALIAFLSAWHNKK